MLDQRHRRWSNINNDTGQSLYVFSGYITLTQIRSTIDSEVYLTTWLWMTCQQTRDICTPPVQRWARWSIAKTRSHGSSVEFAVIVVICGFTKIASKWDLSPSGHIPQQTSRGYAVDAIIQILIYSIRLKLKLSWYCGKPWYSALQKSSLEIINDWMIWRVAVSVKCDLRRRIFLNQK